jgi:hypothetical protein
MSVVERVVQVELLSLITVEQAQPHHKRTARERFCLREPRASHCSSSTLGGSQKIWKAIFPRPNSIGEV